MQGGFPTVVTSDVDVIHGISLKHFHSFHAKIPNPLDPDPVSDEHVHMFASRGERWKRMRTITSEAMSNKNMKQLFPIVEESVVSFLNYLEKLPFEQGIDAHKLFQNHTSDVLARCAFGQTRSLHGENSYHNIFSQAFGRELQAKTFCWNTTSSMFKLKFSLSVNQPFHHFTFAAQFTLIMWAGQVYRYTFLTSALSTSPTCGGGLNE
ncbi:hypothetical protein COOONC_11448 [Cooperia oncophora]